MLNCHDNSISYHTYSSLYRLYEEYPEERAVMEEAIDYIIEQYTVAYKHDTDIAGIDVDFSEIEKPSVELRGLDLFKGKIQYLYKCVSFQLDSKTIGKTSCLMLRVTIIISLK